MATYLTGRTRDHVRSGSISGDLHLVCINPGDDILATDQQDSYRGYIWFDDIPTRLEFDAYFGNGYDGMNEIVALSEPELAIATIRLKAYARTGGTADSGDVETKFSYSGSPMTVSQTIDGTYSLTIPVEEVCDVNVSGSGLTSTIYGQDFPNIGGTATADGIPWAACRFYERAVVDGDLELTATVGGASVTITDNIATTFELEHSLHLEIEIGTLNRTSSASISGAVNGWTAIGTYSYSTADGSVDTTGGGIVVESISSGMGAGDTVTGKMTFFPPKEWEFNGRLRCFGSAYPSSLDFEWKQSSSAAVTETLSPTFTDSISLAKYTGQSDIAGSTDFETVDQWSPQRCWLKGSDLTTEGEDTADWRLQFRGFRWEAFRFALASSVTVDDGTSTTGWTAGASTSLSVVSGAVRLTASGGEGSATRAFTLQYLEPYRYLRLNLSSSSAQTVRVTIGSSYWDVAVTTTAANYDIDLCCGGNETASVGEVTTRYPIDSPGGFPTNDPPSTPYGLGYGTTHCTSIQVSGVNDGTTLDVHDISLSATSRSLTILPPFDYRPLGWDSGTDLTYLWPFLYLQCDDRAPLDIPYAGTVDPNVGTESITYYTLEQLQDDLLDFWPGTTITTVTQPTDGYHDLDLPAGLLGALGATYNHSAGTWGDWLDISVASTTNLYAQDLWDQVDVFPGAGNVWTGSGAYDEATVLAVSKSLRGRAGGNIFKKGGLPFPTAETITLVTDPGAAAAGSSTSDTADGSYLTGTSWGKGSGDHKTKWAAKSLATSARALANRQTIWAGFLAGVARQNLLAYAVRSDLQNFRGYVSGGSATVETADNALTSWAAVGSTVTAEELCLAVQPWGGILLGVIDAGSYKLYRSTGGSFSLSYTVTSTGDPITPCIIAGSDGVVFHYWSDGGTVKGRRYDASGTALGAAYSVSGISTIDEDGIDGDESFGAGGQRIIRLTVRVAGSLTTYSSTDGETFS